MKLRTLLTASFASTALCAVAPAALAAPNTDNLYIGIGTGFSSLENDSEDVDDFISDGTDSYDLDDDEDNVWKGFVGYEFNPYFATELFYTDLGRTRLEGNNGANTDLESNAYGVSLVGKLPLADWFELFAKAGMAKWETDVDANVGGASANLEDNDGIDPVYGVGAQFNFEPILVRAEYERYDFDSDYKIDTFTASVGFLF